jgi:hypothetical protein
MMMMMTIIVASVREGEVEYKTSRIFKSCCSSISFPSSQISKPRFKHGMSDTERTEKTQHCTIRFSAHCEPMKVSKSAEECGTSQADILEKAMVIITEETQDCREEKDAYIAYFERSGANFSKKLLERVNCPTTRVEGYHRKQEKQCRQETNTKSIEM